jgi:hypothetical protein
MTMLRKIKNKWFEFILAINTEEKQFNSESELLAIKEEISDLINQVALDLNDSKLSYMGIIYKVLDRWNMSSLGDVDDKTLRDKLQQYLLERDFN